MSTIIKQDESASVISKRSRGYTLPEVVICLAILALTFGSLWQGVQLAAKTYQHSRENQMVIQLAQQLCYDGHAVMDNTSCDYTLTTRLLGRKLSEKIVTITCPKRQWKFYYVQRLEE